MSDVPVALEGDDGGEVEEIAALAATDYPEEEGDHEVPSDLMEIYLACEDAGISAAEFGSLGGGA